jgi:hypothetical protein
MHTFPVYKGNVKVQLRKTKFRSAMDVQVGFIVWICIMQPVLSDKVYGLTR